MSKYVTYLRTLEGNIERLPNATATQLGPYHYEETLVGWPESKVYWANDRGPAVGLAPLDATSRSDDQLGFVSG
ncbi:hypothetical protein C8R31_10293 [Nitrosospira sp. Nsp2]|uniref:hypothetical protein n=1 Tax=Nitrosospira sp. Nsp2 TaxID=136548 RepID=UPI000D2F82E1|nr:hypothetical protein [Nitrosospira sp. Nsp2]PTR16079.1 hypothetical protein C8R31_10293 [Nitrosospira sp. Nsp2]